MIDRAGETLGRKVENPWKPLSAVPDPTADKYGK